MSGGNEALSAAAPTDAPGEEATNALAGPAASAPPTLSPLDVTSLQTHPPPPPPPEPESAALPSPAASKRRAVSFQDRLPLRAPAAATVARSAVASAFASVSSATTTRFAKFRSRSSEALLKTSTSAPAPAPRAAAAPPLVTVGSWKANVHGFARRARDAAKRAQSGSRAYSWEHPPRVVARAFEYHGEDAGAASAYFHVVSDGVSAPFARSSLAQLAREPVSSALLAQELVLAVQQALKDVTNDNAVGLDAPTFESVVDDIERAVQAAGLQRGDTNDSAASSAASSDSQDALQALCDELVLQSQMKISIERAEELLATAAADAERSPENSSGVSASARISMHGAPVRGLFPFATAAALEYRARALAELATPSDSDGDGDGAAAAGDDTVDHLASSLALFETHKGKRTLDRQQLVRRAASRKHHYSLLQLKRMAEMQTKKPDDITLFVTQFS
ncbi:hypothetical protein PybrP1_009912 [[Pythium] brassicae (nom. inval.)]|nr:hypothetical protein PybrP1_009912 [[Pythium] brassicae (nom. inval.)]